MRWIALAFSALLAVWSAGCGDGGKTVLKVFHAGSLSVPFRELERVFEAQNPQVDVRRQAFGSAAAIRQVTELGRSADVLASSDYRLIDQLMIEADPQSADWNVLLARNSIVVAYDEAAVAITRENWTHVLSEPSVRVGMSSPNHDPCGYRSLCCVYLADPAPGEEGLFRNLVLANSNVVLDEEAGFATLRVPTDVRYSGRLTMRPKETDLAALLEGGSIDYLFIYRSVARQRGLKFLELPDKVNLSDPALAGDYGRVRVCQFADRPERTTMIQASPIVYGLTVPRRAPHRAEAVRFVELVLSAKGRRVLEESGQTPLASPMLSPSSRRAAPMPANLLSR